MVSFAANTAGCECKVDRTAELWLPCDALPYRRAVASVRVAGDRHELANAAQGCALAPLRGRARHDREQL
jgi:hypothetical protein